MVAVTYFPQQQPSTCPAQELPLSCCEWREVVFLHGKSKQQMKHATVVELVCSDFGNWYCMGCRLQCANAPQVLDESEEHSYGAFSASSIQDDMIYQV